MSDRCARPTPLLGLGVAPKACRLPTTRTSRYCVRGSSFSSARSTPRRPCRSSKVAVWLTAGASPRASIGGMRILAAILRSREFEPLAGNSNGMARKIAAGLQQCASDAGPRPDGIHGLYSDLHAIIGPLSCGQLWRVIHELVSASADLKCESAPCDSHDREDEDGIQKSHGS